MSGKICKGRMSVIKLELQTMTTTIYKDQQQEQNLIPIGEVGYMDCTMPFSSIKNQSFRSHS